MKTTVYVYTNKIDGKKYVGTTTQTIKKRAKNGRGYQRCARFWDAIQLHGWDNFECEIVAVVDSTEEACRLEKELISIYKSNQEEYGYNLEAGGKDKGDIAESTRAKLSALGHRKHSPESVERAAAKHRGLKHSEETKRAMSEKRKEMAKTEWFKDHVEKMHASTRKKVAVLDASGNVEAAFESIADAAKSFGTDASCISRVCSGERQLAAGRKWVYLS